MQEEGREHLEGVFFGVDEEHFEDEHLSFEKETWKFWSTEILWWGHQSQIEVMKIKRYVKVKIG